MIVCKYCIAQFGFMLSDKEKQFKTYNELSKHMENFHGIPVMGKGETKEDAAKRCAKKGIVPDRKICMCEECKRDRDEPNKITQHI